MRKEVTEVTKQGRWELCGVRTNHIPLSGDLTQWALDLKIHPSPGPCRAAKKTPCGQDWRPGSTLRAVALVLPGAGDLLERGPA